MNLVWLDATDVMVDIAGSMVLSASLGVGIDSIEKYNAAVDRWTTLHHSNFQQLNATHFNIKGNVPNAEMRFAPTANVRHPFCLYGFTCVECTNV